MPAPTYDLRFDILDEKIEETKARVSKLEIADVDHTVKLNTLNSSVNHLIEKHTFSQQLLTDIHSRILKDEGAKRAIETHKKDEHDHTSLAFTRRSFYTSIIIALIGGSFGIKILEALIKFLGGH